MQASASPSARPEATTAQSLVAAGFTQEQIDKLRSLKAVYPFIEYVETDDQWRRMQFLKWRYQHGDLQRA